MSLLLDFKFCFWCWAYSIMKHYFEYEFHFYNIEVLHIESEV